MNVSYKTLTLISTVALTLAFSGEAKASAFTFNFDTLVSGDAPSGTNIASLTIADSGTNSVLLTLNHNATSASGQFISELYLNLNPFIVPTMTGQTPASKFDGGLNASLNGENTAGLKFDLNQSFQTAPLSARVMAGQSVSFTLTGAGLNATDFLSAAVPNSGQRNDIFAMIHLQGIPGGGSAKIGATNPVPEPASMAALGLGIAGLIRRKKAARKS